MWGGTIFCTTGVDLCEECCNIVNSFDQVTRVTDTPRNVRSCMVRPLTNNLDMSTCEPKNCPKQMLIGTGSPQIHHVNLKLPQQTPCTLQIDSNTQNCPEEMLIDTKIPQMHYIKLKMSPTILKFLPHKSQITTGIPETVHANCNLSHSNFQLAQE